MAKKPYLRRGNDRRENDYRRIDDAFAQRLLRAPLRPMPTVAVLETDSAGRITAVTDSYLRKTGFTRRHLIGRHLAELRVDGDLHQSLRLLATLRAQHQIEFDSTHRTIDGRAWPVMIRARIDVNGRVSLEVRSSYATATPPPQKLRSVRA